MVDNESIAWWCAMTDKPERPVTPSKVLDGLKTIIENAVQAERARWFADGIVPLSVREGKQTPEQWAQRTNDFIKGLQEQRTALANDVERLSKAIVDAEWHSSNGLGLTCPFCSAQQYGDPDDHHDDMHKPDCVVRSARDNLRGYTVVGTTTGITINKEAIEKMVADDEKDGDQS